MMKKIILHIFLVCASTVWANAAPGGFDTTDVYVFARIQNIQFTFIQDYLKKHPFPKRFISDGELEDAYQGITTAWIDHVRNDSLPDVALAPYWYGRIYSMASTDLTEQQHQRIFSRFVAPAFLHNFKTFELFGDKRNVYSIRFPDIEEILSGNPISFQANISREQWSTLSNAYRRMLPLLDDYERQWRDIDTNTVKNIARIRFWIKSYLPLCDIRDDLFAGRLDSASVRLQKALSMDYSTDYLIPLADRLWRAYVADHNVNAAMNIVDQFARNFTITDISNDRLLQWCAVIDPKAGKQYFETKVKTARPDVLVRSKERIELKGEYFDLLSGRTVDLNSLKGKMILFDFWTTWCSACKEDIPKVQKTIAEYGAKIVVISVCSDALTNTADTTAAQRFVQENHISYSALYDLPDRSLTIRLNVDKIGYPRKFLIDVDGHLLVHPRRMQDADVSLEEVKGYLKGR